MKYLSIVFAIIVSLTLEACDLQQSTSDQVQRRAQEQLSAQSNSAVGMPAITKFSEKRMLKDIMEMRDSMPPTFTYILDMNGGLHKICDSVGFGFSGATQFTNPNRVYTGSNYQLAVVPQADPNGLFSPATDEGTWIMCKDPNSDKIGPIRMEPRSIVSPFPLI